MRALWVVPGFRRPLRDAQALQEAVQEAMPDPGPTSVSFQAPAMAC